MSKYLLPLLLLAGCQAEPETPEAVDTQVLIDMVRTSTPNNRWWRAGDTQWSMHTQRLHRRPIATEESRRWLRAWLNRGEN